MHPVRIAGITVTQALDFKQELMTAGLIMDHDFVWRYFQSNHETWTQYHPSSVVFEFRDPAMATFYNLKWAKQ